MVEFRDGARFKKQLTVSDVNFGSKIRDAVVSPLYTSVYDGQISMFPSFELTASNTTLKKGQVPLGSSYASTNYILEFPTLSSPSFGSADLDSINLHFFCKDLNYNNNFNIAEFEVYKFKRPLPTNLGIFPNNTMQIDNTWGGNSTFPELTLIGAGSYSEGPKIFESFDGFGETGLTDNIFPSLYSHGIPASGSLDFYSTIEDAWEMDGQAWWGPDDAAGIYAASSMLTYFRYYGSTVNGQEIVQWKVIGNNKIVPNRSAAGGNPQTSWLRWEWATDDPKYSLWYYDWNTAVSLGEEDEFISQRLKRWSVDVTSSQSEESGIDLTVDLPSYALSADNTFFDEVLYTSIRRSTTEKDDITGRADITAVSTPHFSSGGSPSSGQCARFYCRTETSDDNSTNAKNMRAFGKDNIGYSSIRAVKQIPKPLPMARKEGTTEQLDSMRIRIKFKIEEMHKMHKTGKGDAWTYSSTGKKLMTGNNLCRSLVVMLATRQPYGYDTLGAYLHKLNTGRPFNNWNDNGKKSRLLRNRSRFMMPHAPTTRLTFSGAYNAANFLIASDTYNKKTQWKEQGAHTTSGSADDWKHHNYVSQTNNYNGVAIMRVPLGKVVDTDDSNPDGRSNEEAEGALELDGRFFLFHTGRSYGRFNHWDGYYAGDGNKSDTQMVDFTPFVVKQGIQMRRGDEFKGISAKNPPLVDEFEVGSCTTTAGPDPTIGDIEDCVADTEYLIYTSGTSDWTEIGAADSNAGTIFIATGAGTGTGTMQDITSNTVTLANWHDKIHPGMMVTQIDGDPDEGINRALAYHGGLTVFSINSTNKTFKLGTYTNGSRLSGSALAVIKAGTHTLKFRGGITPMGPSAETYEYLSPSTNMDTGVDMAQKEWYYLDAYINHNSNPDAWGRSGVKLSGPDGDQSTITWVVSDMNDVVLAKKTQCHSGGGGAIIDHSDLDDLAHYSTTTAAPRKNTAIEVSNIEKFQKGDVIAFYSPNSQYQERMIVEDPARDHGMWGTSAMSYQTLNVKRGAFGDTIRDMTSTNTRIYHVPRSQSNMACGFPNYLSIWVNNIKVGLWPPGASGDNFGEAIGEDTFWSEDSTSVVDVMFDYIDISNFQPNLNNMTPTAHQGSRGTINISSERSDLIINLDNITVGEKLSDAEFEDADADRLPTPTYMTWGSKTNIWQDKMNYIFLGGFNTSNPSLLDASDDAKRIRFAQSSETSDIRFFTFPSQTTTPTGPNTPSDYSVYNEYDTPGAADGTDESHMGFGLVRMGSQYAQRGNNFNDYVHMGTSASHSASDDLRVDSFTKKGFIKIASPKFDGDPTTEVTGGSTGKFILRENPLFSTKITKIISATKGEIEIAGSDALKAFIDDEFIIYRLGYPWEHGGGSAAESNEGTPLGHYYRRGVFIKSLDTNNNKVFLEHSSTKGFGNSTKNLLYSEYGPHTLLHDNYLSELYISPLRYWVNCEIYNRAESTKEKLPDVSYTHSLVCDSSTVVRDEFDPALTVNAPPNVSNLGLTFEEYLYSDTTVPANKWVLGEDAEKSIVERMVDYGFGTFKDGQSLNAMDLESGMGYINKQTAQANENIIELKGLVKVEKERLLDSSEKVTLLIKASRESTGSGTILSTKYSEVGWLPSRVAPRLTYVYKDALPTIEDFMVKPYKEDPFLSEYSWETSDDDLWYGFLILDRESILHQYHKASLHIPLNEVPAETVNDTLGYNNSNPFTKGEETFAYPYITGGQYTANIREASSVAVNLAPTVEGLAGNSLYFYGSTNTIDKQILVFKYPLPATTNLSILAHFTIDSLDSSSGRVRGIAQQTNNKGYIISAPEDANGTNNCYSIWIDSSGRVNAQVITKDLTADVTLISKYVVPVGTDEPVCVILTVDTELAVGNVKLFINGKLEDQSGKKTVAGSSNNWKTGQDIGEVDISIYVGSQSRNPGGGFDGVRSIKNMFNGTIEELVIYNHTIYPVIPTNGKMVLTKPIEELTDSSETAAGRPIVAKLFIKDYHNIRGKTREEVAQTSQISVRKAGLGLKTST